MLTDTIQIGPRVQLHDGIIMFYDSTRDKWLSNARQNLTFGIDNKNISHDRWMKMTGGVYSNSTGYRLPREATITSISAESKLIINDSVFEIRKNRNASSIVTLDVIGATGDEKTLLDIDLNAGDFLQAFLNIRSGTVDYPELFVEFCWRKP